MVQQKNEERTKQQERAERILDAAAELVQRWGYKKTTIDDIARQARVAKGTIYLHWKTREDLFLAVLMREQMREAREVEQWMANDPEGRTLRGVIKYSMLAGWHNPLIRAVTLRDTEMLGELAHSEFGQRDIERRQQATRTFLDVMRAKRLIRTDIDLDAQLYMLSAITTGFMLVDQFLPEKSQIPIEQAAELVAETIRCTFELRNPTSGEQQEIATTLNKVLQTIQEQRQKEMES
ncbi:MAG: TetR/AcrR family transcriptional regulator [Ktedonobacteraceae bacterium]|nr:TetR/AcrR family transcriptional regulator [Ktedonobacteraceae bacterium]